MIGGTAPTSTILGHARRPVTADVTRDLAAAGRVTDHDRAVQIEPIHHRREVICVGVHIVAGGWLVRATMATPVVRDHAIAVLEHEEHLPVPDIARQRPAVREHDRPTLAPVLAEEAGVVGSGHEAHLGSP